MKKQYGLLYTWVDPETGEHQWAFKPDDTPLNELAKFQQELEATEQNVAESETKCELSDDEITDLASKYIERATSTLRDECIEFARAILRKAQEK